MRRTRWGSTFAVRLPQRVPELRRPVIPPGLRTFYVPSLVAARITEVLMFQEGWPPPSGGTMRDRYALQLAIAKRLGANNAGMLSLGWTSPVVRIVLLELGIEARGYQNQVRMRCAGCGRRAAILLAAELESGAWAWRCPRWCFGKGYASRLEQLLGAYAFAWRIGLRTGPQLKRIRRRLVKELALLGPRARTPHDLLMLSCAGSLLGTSMRRRWRWASGAPVQPASGPLKALLRPLLLHAVIDACLHPDAFLERYVRQDGDWSMPV